MRGHEEVNLFVSVGRKYELYSMDWDLKEELRDCLVAAAPYGGPIALLRNPWRKEKVASVRPILEIYSASGVPLVSLLWKSGPVVSMGWSAEEELLCVQEDGAVLVYGLHGDFRRHFSMGNEVLQNRVLDARIFHTELGSGVAILTGAHRFTLSANVGDLKLRRMPEVPGALTKLRFVLDEDSYLVPELDGVRIFSRSTHEFLHEVPVASEEIFKIASMAPGALLLEAQKEYEKESQKADEYLREIQELGQLTQAVQQCIEAAGHEHRPDMQKSLLRAASFGKCFLDRFPPDSFVRMCQDLRVLNAVRDYHIGIPLTYSQLVLRRLYPLAIQICEYLRLPEVQQKDVSDEDVARAINQKLGDTPGVSYSDIAARAYGCGRTELAIKLLEYEPRSGEQVPLLLKMKRSKLALSKAIESGDTDLVFTVLLHLKNELNRGDFFMTLRNQPMALSLYRQFCKHQELETLKDLYNQDDNHQELGSFHLRASYTEERIEGRVAALQTAADAFYKAKNEFSAKATEDQMRLLRLQRRLEDDLGGHFLDLSLHDTVTTLIVGGHNKRAEQLARDFRIPDKRLWWLKLTALADLEDWEELEKFSKSKKSPIGYLPFVEICMKQHNKYEAKKYASRVGPEQKVKALLLVGDIAQAADVAIEHRNEAELSLVLSHCTGASDGATADKIQRARAQAQKK
ncbi:Vacuolar protein sorting-associated protein 16 like protein [Fukomys damarensis]|uniref:Vacuolar protein sorting-associated protein 16 homolog n=1 Tax=Fukomys damarensis TaxID=885580 RepID=A0A091CNK7_FUKDA|nr:Vacuolar protein sorting-associated protein 16 like protein [Fukomys damarensis]